jgi:hypothetical protein
MKYAFTFIFLVISTAVFSMPCPTNDYIITKGDALESVIEKCGAPANRKDYVLTTPLSEEWTYYKLHSYDQNYSRYIILIKNNNVVNITVNDNNINNPLTCNGQIIQVGYSSQALLSACGNPSKKEDLQIDTTPITELTYPSSPPKTLKFVRGQLTEWK